MLFLLTYREKYGKDYFTRVSNVFSKYFQDGYDITSTVVRGRAHKNMRIKEKEYKGINDSFDDVLEAAYYKSVVKLRQKELGYSR